MPRSISKVRTAGLVLAAATGLSLAPAAGASADQAGVAGYMHLCRNGDRTACTAYSPAGACRPMAPAVFKSATNGSNQGQIVYPSHNCKGPGRYLPPGAHVNNYTIQSYEHS
ncbi:hypothetical protein GCM10010182_01840 [Actinomadura cremea]|nr:hypothetical protein GCM10010182_01840 [Actinomadura cremea]